MPKSLIEIFINLKFEIRVYKMSKIDKTPIISEKKVKYEGVFDMKEMYQALKDYLDGERHYDISEKDLVEKNSGGEREIVSKSEAELQYTDYFKIIIKYTIEMKGKEIEIEINNKKRVMTKGVAILKTNAYVQNDFLGKRGSSPLMEFVTSVYDKYFGKEEFTALVGATAKDVNELNARFKQQINSKLL
jgi:hypothetical protein